MAAGVRDVDRRRMSGAAVAAHAPRGHTPVRTCRLRADASRPRCTAGPRAHPAEPGLHPWRHVCGRLALVRDALAAVLLWTPAIAGRSLWCAGVSIHLGTDRADDLQRLSAAPLPNSLPEHESGGRNCGVRLVVAACLHAFDL